MCLQKPAEETVLVWTAILGLGQPLARPAPVKMDRHGVRADMVRGIEPASPHQSPLGESEQLQHVLRKRVADLTRFGQKMRKRMRPQTPQAISPAWTGAPAAAAPRCCRCRSVGYYGELRTDRS